MGTTVATNAVLQRLGPTVLFVTNEGFKDVPFIGRLDKERLYDLHWQKPRPLVLRRHCLGVAGRVDHNGEIVERLDPQELDRLRERLRELGEDGAVVAISCLFSYLNPVARGRDRGSGP